VIAEVQSLRKHSLAAVAADTFYGPNDVEEKSIDGKSLHDFGYQLRQEIAIGRIHAEMLIKAGFERWCSHESAVGLDA